MQSLTPNFFVSDIMETIGFYSRLGFRPIVSVPESYDENGPDWVMMSAGEVLVMFQTFDSIGEDLPEVSRQPGGSLLLYIKLDRIREFYDHLAGWANIIKPLETTFYGAIEFSITDCNGYVLTFAQDAEPGGVPSTQEFPDAAGQP